MKRIIPLVFLCLFSFGIIQAQTTHIGSLILENQADVNLFVQNNPNCTQVTGGVFLGNFAGGNDSIYDISGLSTIELIGTSNLDGIFVRHTKLTSIKFPNLRGTIHDMHIINNPHLQLVHFPKLEKITSSNSSSVVIISSNASLLTIDFDSLTHIAVGAGLIMHEVRDRVYFPLLDTIITDTNVSFNRGITLSYSNIDSIQIPSIKYIVGDLYVQFCPNLAHLNCFIGLPFCRNVVVRNNPALSDCSGICPVLSNINTASSSVHTNLIGCNSVSEVLSICNPMSTNDFERFTRLKLYPNPTTGMVNINFPDKYAVEVYDLGGRKLHEINGLQGNYSLDLTILQKGLYLIKINTESGSKVQRVILN